jgi:hypothetical protein
VPLRSGGRPRWSEGTAPAFGPSWRRYGTWLSVDEEIEAAELAEAVDQFDALMARHC